MNLGAMRFYVPLLFALLLLPSHARAAERISKEEFASQGRKRAYYLFVPDSVKAGAPAPLVLLLHGSGRNGLSLVEKWKDLASREGFIVAGPDASNSQGWSMTDDGADLLRDLVETLKSKYPVNTRRIYLFGHSAGAVFALNLAMLESEYFAAVEKIERLRKEADDLEQQAERARGDKRP